MSVVYLFRLLTILQEVPHFINDCLYEPRFMSFLMEHCSQRFWNLSGEGARIHWLRLSISYSTGVKAQNQPRGILTRELGLVAEYLKIYDLNNLVPWLSSMFCRGNWEIKVHCICFPDIGVIQVITCLVPHLSDNNCV